jgi:serine/threonine protein kinase
MILLKLAEAIHMCHKKKIIHRDIKLENVMIHKDHSVKLIDFGYGQVILRFPKLLNRYCGTPYYMPPEMIKKIPYDGKVWVLLIIC